MKRLVFVLLILNACFAIVSLGVSYLAYKETAEFTGYASNQGQISLVVEGDDTISPFVNITHPTNSTYTSQVNSLNYTVYDSFGLDSCWYSVDQGQINYSINCGENLTGLSSSVGSNIWTVYANDTSGNENSSSVTFFYSSGGGSGSSSTSSGGGGSGSTIEPPREPLIISSGTEINVAAKSGEQKVQQIFLRNAGSVPLTVTLTVTGIDGFSVLESKEIVLAPGEQRSLNLVINAGDPGVYAGKVILSYGSVTKEIFVLMNVRSANALFDVSLSLPQFSKIISPGNLLKGFISLLQVGPAQDVDVTVNYLIKDFEGNTLKTESETFRVFKSKSYVRDFDTTSLPVGDYIAGIEVVYPEGIATSSAHFTVSDFQVDIWFIVSIILGVVVLVVITYSFVKVRGMRKK